MQQLKKSIEKLLKKKRQISRPKYQSQSKINNNYSQYVQPHSPRQQTRLKTYNLMEEHRQKEQNLRLFSKLKNIKSRNKVNERSAQQQKMLDNIYQLNMASRKLHRKIKEKDIEHKNSQFIERIVQIKTHHSPHLVQTLPLEQSRHRRKNVKSVFLPPISSPEPN